MLMYFCAFFFFFFQAEDGIRDADVTGVQTCALPISSNIDQAYLIITLKNPRTSLGFIDRFLVSTESFRIPATLVVNKMRSEERRVGKECRCRWWPYD